MYQSLTCVPTNYSWVRFGKKMRLCSNVCFYILRCLHGSFLRIKFWVRAIFNAQYPAFWWPCGVNLEFQILQAQHCITKLRPFSIYFQMTSINGHAGLALAVQPFTQKRGGVLYCFDYFLSLFMDTDYKLSYGKGGAGEVLSLHMFLGSHLTETSER